MTLKARKKSAYHLYLVCSLIQSMLFYLVFSIEYVYMLNTIHLNAFQMVIVGVVLQFFCVIFEIPTGIVADSYSRKYSIIIGFIMTGIGFLIEGFMPNFIFLLIAQAIWGIGSTFISGSLQAWIVDEEKDVNLDKVFLRGSQYEQIGAVIGIILSIVIGNVKEYLPIVISGFLFIVFALYLVITMPELNFIGTKPKYKEALQESFYSFYKGLIIIRKEKVLSIFLGIAVAWGLASEGYDRLWTSHLLSNFNNKQTNFLNDVTLVGTLELISMFVSVFLIEYLIRKVETDALHMRAILFIVNFLNIGLIALFALSENVYLLAVLHVFIFTLRSANQPTLSSNINKDIPQEIRATAISVYNQMDNIGQIVGGLIVAFIAGKYSVSIGILITIGFLLPALLLIFKLTRC